MISASTSSGAAERQLVVILISGSSTSGVSCTGRRPRLMAPNNTASSTATTTATGLLKDRRVRFTAALSRFYY